MCNVVTLAIFLLVVVPVVAMVVVEVVMVVAVLVVLVWLGRWVGGVVWWGGEELGGDWVGGWVGGLPVGNGKERGGWERAGGEGVVMGWETGTYGHRCIRSRSWILFGGHPLKLERYRED